MASAERPRVSIRIHQLGRAKLGGHYTLVVLEHPESGSDSPIGSDQPIRSDREGVLHKLCDFTLLNRPIDN